MDISHKCQTEGCIYKKHNNINNNGLYCCRRCMNGFKKHGPMCQRVYIEEGVIELYKAAEKLIDKIVLLVEEDSDGGKRHYRFGDVVYHCGAYWEESTDFILNNNRFVGSILREYIENTPHNNKKKLKNLHYIKLLSEIVQNKVKQNLFKVPDKNELVIHLRLGDYVEKGTFLKKDYVKLIKHELSKNDAINKITICTAFHYGNNITQNAWIYTDDKHQQNISRLKTLLVKLLTSIRLPFHIKSSANPDDDFVYMVEAKNFIKDVGRFSGLIQEIRDYRNSELLPKKKS